MSLELTIIFYKTYLVADWRTGSSDVAFIGLACGELFTEEFGTLFLTFCLTPKYNYLVCLFGLPRTVGDSCEGLAGGLSA